LGFHAFSASPGPEKSEDKFPDFSRLVGTLNKTVKTVTENVER